VVILGIVAIAGLGIGWTAISRAHDTQQALTTEMKTVKGSFAHDLGVLQQRQAEAEKTNGELQSDLSVVTKRLRLTQGELKKARGEAAQIRDENAQQLAAMDTAVKGELATKASTEEVKAVSGEVSGVRSDLDTTKENLQMAKGELGTLIARNHEQIEQLRRLGQRDYVEFTLEGRHNPQKVGNITVELRSVTPKKNQFTLALVVDDLRVEKRNRSVNEPIFFYTKGARQPLELVVNQVAKDKVVGYLSIPKVNQTSSGS
jgi:chromosome segregation ATPase